MGVFFFLKKRPFKGVRLTFPLILQGHFQGRSFLSSATILLSKGFQRQTADASARPYGFLGSFKGTPHPSRGNNRLSLAYMHPRLVFIRDVLFLTP